MDRSELLAEVRRIAAARLHGLPVRVYLFGSFARGEERATSDIDVGVWAEQPLPRRVFAALRTDYEESRLPYHVDVVDLSQVNADFRRAVFEEGIEWTV
ncbi:MAG: nucleotidyltransferase domain-containing protein [Alicyclobacillus sp.]|nr:nucleotidyltransferase domain-containing protein [Alicyclobacillus sp.]